MQDNAKPFDETSGTEMWRTRASAWDKWADHMAKLADGMNQPLLDAADIAAGQQVLDIASGVGQPMFSILDRIGPDGHVTATDAVPEMLTALRRRVAEAGIGNVAVEQADMEALPFDDGRFDRVTCRFGIMFTPDPGHALSEMRRVLKPGGVAAAMVWGEQARVTMFDVIDQVTREKLGDSPFGETRFTPYRLGRPGDLTALLASAGFADHDEQEIRFSSRIDASIPFWRPNLEMTLGEQLAELDERARTDLEDAVIAGFEPFRDGRDVVLQSEVRIAVGRK